MNPKQCPECNKPMSIVIPKSVPKKGEFHCYDCHKSIRMTEVGEAEHWASVVST